MRGTEFAELSAFVAVAEEASFTKAAKRLGLSTATLSQTIRSLEERLGVSAKRVVDCIGEYGNTSAASIPIALDEAWRAGKIKKNDVIIFVAFGGGLTWANAVVRI